MKLQSGLVFGIIFAIVIAIFAIVNMEQVPVNYVFGEAMWPLILVILGSTLIGAIISASFATVRLFSLQRQVKGLDKQVEEQQLIINEKDSEILRLRTELEEKEVVQLFEEADIAEDHGPYLSENKW